MNDPVQCFRFLAASRQAADLVSDDATRAWLLHDIAVTQAGVGDIPAALQTAESIDAEKAFVKCVALRRVADAQLQRGDVSGVVQTLAEARKIGPWKDHLQADVTALAKVGAVAEAEEVAKRLLRSNKYEFWKALGLIAGEQAARGDLAGAMRTASDIKAEDYRADAFCAVAAETGRLSDGPESRQFLEIIREAANHLAHADDKTKVLLMVSETQSAAGDLAGVMATAKMAARKPTLKNNILRTAVTAFAERDDVAAVSTLVKAIVGIDEKTNALCDATKDRARHGALATAEALVDLIPHGECRDAALRKIAIAQAEAGDLGAAGATLRAATAGDPNEKQTDWCRVAIAGMARDPTFARQIFDEVKASVSAVADSHERWFATQRIATAQADAGDITAALETVATLPKVGPKIGDGLARSIFRAYVRIHDWLAARVAVDAIPPIAMRSLALCELTVALLEVGRPAEAQEAFDEALRLHPVSTHAWEVGGLPLQVAIAVGHARNREVAGARRILDGIEEEAAREASFAAAKHWRDLVSARAQSGDFAGAIASCTAMPEAFSDDFRGTRWGDKARLVAEVAALFLTVTSVSEAEAWAEALPDATVRAGAYIGLAKTLSGVDNKRADAARR